MIRDFGLVLSWLIEKYGVENAIKTDEGIFRMSFDRVLMNTLEHPLGWIAGVALLLCAALGYFIGSINFALLISKLFYKDDVRRHGSGNAGATNMLRTYGRAAGIATFVLDGVKGAFSVLAAMLVMGEGGAWLAGLFCILGHVFPVYYKFRGGKGVVVAAVTILALEPISFIVLVVLFVMIVASSKYISLGSVICAFFFPLLHNAFGTHGFLSTVISVLIAAIVIVMHRANIKRLLNRTESKVSFKKKAS